MGLFDFIGDIFGGGASSSAKKSFAEQQRLNTEAQGLRQQGVDYYKQQGQEASGDRNTARQGNNAYAGFGLSDRQNADYNLSDLYSQYARGNNISGFGSPSMQKSGSTAPPTPIPQFQGGTFNGTTFGSGRTPQETASAASQTPAQSANAPQDTEQSPYALQPAQQQQLNQGVDRINAERKTALDNYKAQALETGGAVNPAMEAYINDHYDQLSNEHTTQAHETARQQQMQGLAALIQQFTNQRNQGGELYGQSIGNNLQIGNQALQQGANAPFGQYASQTSNEAAQMGQMGMQFQQQADQILSSLVQLGFSLGGGFGGAALGGIVGNAVKGSPTTPALEGAVPRQRYA